MTSLLPQAERCPLCAGANACGMALANPDPAGCWCQTVQVSAAALERIPQALRGVACLCVGCARDPDPPRPEPL